MLFFFSFHVFIFKRTRILFIFRMFNSVNLFIIQKYTALKKTKKHVSYYSRTCAPHPITVSETSDFCLATTSYRGKKPPLVRAAVTLWKKLQITCWEIQQALLLYPVYTVIFPISRILFIQTPPMNFLFILL